MAALSLADGDVLARLRSSGHPFARVVADGASGDTRKWKAYDERDEWMARVPTTPLAAERLQRATRLAATLAAHLPLPVGGTTISVAAGAGFPYVIVCERRPRGAAGGAAGGAAIDTIVAARALGQLCAALHRIPVDLLLELGLRARKTQHDNLARMFMQISTQYDGLRAQLPERLRPHCDAFIGAADVPRPNLKAVVVIHGNLLADSVLIEGGSVTGIVGWENLNLGDPATDLAGVYLWLDEAGLELLVEPHPHRGPELVERVRFVAKCAGFLQLLAGVARRQEALVNGGIHLLERFVTKS